MRMKNLFMVLVLLHVVCMRYVVGKECTDQPSDMSRNAVLRQAYQTSGPPPDIDAMYQKIKMNFATVNESSKFLREVPLSDVRLDPDSMYGFAQQTNLEYLLMLDVDSLVWNFRKTANLPTPGLPYNNGGWENSTSEIRGHFVGHYLSATAQTWASTKNRTVFDKMNYLVSALDLCQKKIGTGYLSAFPEYEFDLVESVQKVWAPYYTLHKIMAGLLDQYTLGGNDQALNIVVWMADYFTNRVLNLIAKYSLERHYLSLNTEYGGMNDLFYRLYTITGNQTHLVMGTLFDKPCFLGMLAMQTDSLGDFHVNTHLAITIGTQKRYEITGEPLYKGMSTFLMNTINSSHSYATGGTSMEEHWHDPRRLATTLNAETEETCTTYNMLKMSRHLFRWTKQIEYADYYERALVNGILSVQRGREPGVMIYMLPLSRGSSKSRSKHGWGTKFSSFWCCYGTGIESFSKLGDSIYFEEDGDPLGLYVIQYISSSFDWKSGGMMIHQKVKPAASYDRNFGVVFNFTRTAEAGKSTVLNFRIPRWADETGVRAKLNGDDLPLSPGNVLSISRNWNSGDTFSLDFPMKVWTEAIKDDRPEYSPLRAIFYGPYLLAGLAGLTTDDLNITTGGDFNSDWLTPIPATYHSQLITLSQQSQADNKSFVLTNTNSTLSMETMPPPGNETAVWATFRVIFQDLSSSGSFSGSNFVGKSVMLEPLDLPGTRIVQQEQGEINQYLSVANAEDATNLAMFRVVEGLDKNGTVSLESENQKGCFVYTGVNYTAGTWVKLACQSGDSDTNFATATSFTLNQGLTEYHPVSFVAKGSNRNYLMMPLLSLRDETYTVYFNMTL